MIILGIDPGIATVGFGIINKERNVTTVIDYGIISTPKTDPLPVRLEKIYSSIIKLIEKYNPTVAAVEELFFNKNIKTAFPVAQGRGVAVLACMHKKCELFEYTPLQIKQALTGNGRAEKHQVQFMVKAILKLKTIPKPDDAADALAIALCHGQTNTFLSQTQMK